MPPDTQPPGRSSRELFDELTQIVGGLAHEMKNPLSTISLNLKLLGEDLGRFHDAEHERLSRRLGRVQEETERVQQILNDFLRYAGKFELACQTVDLCDVVGQLRDFFAPQAEAARVVFRTALPDGPLPCSLDPNLIKQALLNLLINAVQAMSDGGELLLRLTARDNQAVIEVTDTGSGIAPDVLENIFRPYWSSKEGGSGLGLPTARRIAREHGGTLTVESEPGKGTRFVLTLPTQQEA